MYKRKRLHPIAMILRLGKNIKDMLIPIAILLFSGFKENHLLFFVPVIGLLLYIFISVVLSWLRHTYQLSEKELRIEHGIFIRKNRYIPYERIQSIDITEGVLQRVFGLVKVQIETAGGNALEGAEAVLSAISKKDAQEIQEFFMATKKVCPAEIEAADMPVYQITTGQLVLLSFTSGGVGVIISAVFAGLTQLDNVIPYKKIFGNAEKLVTNSILLTAIMVLIVFIILWIIAFIRTMFKYANFSVRKTENELIITQGLLARRQLTIPLNRIQVVRISENILRQMVGLATVYLESAGGSAENIDGARVMIIPIMKRDQISKVIHPILPDYHITDSFHPVPKRAAQRYILRSWFFGIPVLIVSLVFLEFWGLFSLIIFAAANLLAYLQYKDAGWDLKNQQLSFRHRTINRNTVFMKKNRIQSLNLREGYFQRKKGLVTIEAFVKSGAGIAGGQIKDLSLRDSEEIYSWYSLKKEG